MQASFDALAWTFGLWMATFLRFEMQISKVDIGGVVLVATLAAVLQVAIGTFAGLYVHRWRYGTFEEVAASLRVTVGVAVLITLLDLSLLGHAVPVSAAIVSAFLTLSVMSAGRLGWRMLLDRWTLAKDDGREPIIVMGAGDGGLQIVTAMLKSGPFHPVAILDDNPSLRKLRIKGVHVAGDRSQLAAVVERTGASTLIIAIPSADGETVRDLAGRADALGLDTLILPPVAELFGVGVTVGDIRPLTEADLLGRRELSLDIDSVAGYLTGRRVLVTGAGGSIGSELCRQIHRFAPASLVMLDRDESALQGVQLSIEGRGLLDSRNLVVACIRDAERMAEVFDEHRPEVVFHAAALKHLPLLEMHESEGWKTNVWGTQNLLDVAGKFDVERFVNISTDKAADSTSVLGNTKRVAEQLTSFAGKTQDGTYLSVRFGNVLGSRGSVLPLFREQIARGGPVTVTHPEVTRYFMTIPEACELVIQAGALDSHDGKVLVLDMGEPVRIADLARRLVKESGKRIEVVYTGLRPGEKLHEVLFAPEERAAVSEHPLISWVDVPAMSPEVAAEADARRPARVDLRNGTFRGAVVVGE
ncbi:MAG: polysaccharide biosynthesis protein [Actinomycetota bacterium]|nr:polysaccharide biosynthesis protein [Actinomycetota bacterium]